MSETCPLAVGVSGSIELQATDSFVPKTCTTCLEGPLRSASEQIPDKVLEEFEDDCMDYFADTIQHSSTLRWTKDKNGLITVTRESHQTWVRAGEEISTEWQSRKTAKLVCEKEVQLALWVDEC